MSAPGHAEHITPYDRMGLDEATLVAMLASPTTHAGLVEYFGEELHADLVALARASLAAPGAGGRRVYVLPGIMGSQLGYIRAGKRPNDIVWLDPVDINFGRLAAVSVLRDERSSPSVVVADATIIPWFEAGVSIQLWTSASPAALSA